MDSTLHLRPFKTCSHLLAIFQIVHHFSWLGVFANRRGNSAGDDGPSSSSGDCHGLTSLHHLFPSWCQHNPPYPPYAREGHDDNHFLADQDHPTDTTGWLSSETTHHRGLGEGAFGNPGDIRVLMYTVMKGIHPRMNPAHNSHIPDDEQPPLDAGL